MITPEELAKDLEIAIKATPGLWFLKDADIEWLVTSQSAGAFIRVCNGVATANHVSRFNPERIKVYVAEILRLREALEKIRTCSDNKGFTDYGVRSLSFDIARKALGK